MLHLLPSNNSSPQPFQPYNAPWQHPFQHQQSSVSPAPSVSFAAQPLASLAFGAPAVPQPMNYSNDPLNTGSNLLASIYQQQQYNAMLTANNDVRSSGTASNFNTADTVSNSARSSYSQSPSTNSSITSSQHLSQNENIVAASGGNTSPNKHGLSSAFAVVSPEKRARKPYTISRPREMWSPQEHERFKEAIAKYDRDWKRIADHIGTKSVIQIRSHAQKHFLKLQKQGLGQEVPPPKPRRKTETDLSKMNEAVQMATATPSTALHPYNAMPAVVPQATSATSLTPHDSPQSMPTSVMARQTQMPSVHFRSQSADVGTMLERSSLAVTNTPINLWNEQTLAQMNAAAAAALPPRPSFAQHASASPPKPMGPYMHANMGAAPSNFHALSGFSSAQGTPSPGHALSPAPPAAAAYSFQPTQMQNPPFMLHHDNAAGMLSTSTMSSAGSNNHLTPLHLRSANISPNVSVSYEPIGLPPSFGSGQTLNLTAATNAFNADQSLATDLAVVQRAHPQCNVAELWGLINKLKDLPADIGNKQLESLTMQDRECSTVLMRLLVKSVQQRITSAGVVIPGSNYTELPSGVHVGNSSPATMVATQFDSMQLVAPGAAHHSPHTSNVTGGGAMIATTPYSSHPMLNDNVHHSAGPIKDPINGASSHLGLNALNQAYRSFSAPTNMDASHLAGLSRPPTFGSNPVQRQQQELLSSLFMQQQQHSNYQQPPMH